MLTAPVRVEVAAEDVLLGRVRALEARAREAETMRAAAEQRAGAAFQQARKELRATQQPPSPAVTTAHAEVQVPGREPYVGGG